MPWALANATRCMIYVVTEELIPENKEHEHNTLDVWAIIVSFAMMMLLDYI